MRAVRGWEVGRGGRWDQFLAQTTGWVAVLFMGGCWGVVGRRAGLGKDDMVTLGVAEWEGLGVSERVVP